ncbi:HD domain-containing protein [Myxococcota bacterium]|nr:HD domain-containing protein [Myxococcota bacterium]
MDPSAQRRLREALALALDAHGEQTRKGTAIPYSSHLLQVAGMVLEYGGSSDQAIAALLHDTLEDCEGISLESISDRFGETVARIVADCSDLLPGDTPATKSPWKDRKRHYLSTLSKADETSLLVAACDKRHNLGCLVRDLAHQGPSYLNRFSAGAEDQIWYFETILEILDGRIPPLLLLELEALVNELRVSLRSP